LIAGSVTLPVPGRTGASGFLLAQDQVTASWDIPGFAGGAALQVLVVSNATEAGVSSIAILPNQGPNPFTLTPITSGSMLLWTYIDTQRYLTFTATAGNALVSEYGVASPGWTGVFGYYAGLITANTLGGYTLGATAPYYDVISAVAYELPGSGGIPVIRTVTPPVAGTSSSLVSGSVSSAVFAAPPGSVLVAMFAANSGSSSGTLAFTDSLGLTWSTRTAMSGTSGTVVIATATVPGGTSTGIPAAPSGLTVTALTGTTASLSWTPPPGPVTSYNIYRNGTVVASTMATSWSDSGLIASTNYTYSVTARNIAGTGPKAPAIGLATPASGSLPGGVTLHPIDGGSDYYADNGLTYASNAGWDNPSFFPIGVWFQHPLSGVPWNDLNINTICVCFPTDDPADAAAAGLWLVPSMQMALPAGIGAETVGLMSYDEGSFVNSISGPFSSTANAIQDGRFWWSNSTLAFLYYGGMQAAQTSPQVVDASIATPNGASRHLNVISVDMYWYSGWIHGETGGVDSGSSASEGNTLYQLGQPNGMTIAQAQCGARYGDAVDILRSFQQGGLPLYPSAGLPHGPSPVAYAAPVLQFIENGQPNSLDPGDGSTYITPAQMNVALWASIIHGARMICYFDHSFSGPGASNNNFVTAYYLSPQGSAAVSIYNQAKNTNTLVKALAPVIAAPTVMGYVTALSPANAEFAGLEVMVKYYQGKFWIFADYRGAETDTAIAVSFTTAGGYSGTVTAYNADGNVASGYGNTYTLTASGGVFSDTFAYGYSVRIYQVG
jgi:Fibronectin type III domain